MKDKDEQISLLELDNHQLQEENTHMKLRLDESRLETNIQQDASLEIDVLRDEINILKKNQISEIEGYRSQVMELKR